MRVTVLLFSSYAEAIGAQSLELDLQAGAKVGDIVTLVRKKAGGKALPPALVAINQEYAPDDRVLAADDEVAIIPPVAGG